MIADGVLTTWRETATEISGAGATMATYGAFIRRRSTACSTKGGGAITGVFSRAIFLCKLLVARSGIEGRAEFHATMFGAGTSCVSLMSGGVTIVCVRLSDSGGIERMGCRANSGSPFCGARVSVFPVSSGGRYSDGEK